MQIYFIKPYNECGGISFSIMWQFVGWHLNTVFLLKNTHGNWQRGENLVKHKGIKKNDDQLMLVSLVSNFKMIKVPNSSAAVTAVHVVSSSPYNSQKNK